MRLLSVSSCRRRLCVSLSFVNVLVSWSANASSFCSVVVFCYVVVFVNRVLVSGIRIFS